jgi:predicted amino acid-binding ACT domain protein
MGPQGHHRKRQPFFYEHNVNILEIAQTVRSTTST